MKNWKLNSVALLLFLLGHGANAQQEVPMADGMRAEGKIYVIVAIVLIILTGLVVYLFTLDRKVKHLENRLK
ncbi:MAG: CcmD family protein [Cyclobacteriaceae bacterium]|nr:CcmD family protein [Cyclobacteriaceae bacterium]